MNWRLIHRWLGLTAGTVALVLGITGTILAFYPVRDAFQSVPAPADMSIATLVQNVSRSTPGVEEIRRLSSGDIVVYASNGEQSQAVVVDPANGQALHAYQPSPVARWVKNLHRSFLLGDAGRLTAAGVALAMFLLSATGLLLTARRMGGWRRMGDKVRGTLAQRLHVVTGRIVFAVLCLSSVTALYMSAATFGLVPAAAPMDPNVVSVAGRQADLPGGKLPLLQTLQVQDLRKLSFPAADDPADTWKVSTSQGDGWVDRRSGRTLAWEDAATAQRIQYWVKLLHTGEGAWIWAMVLGLVAASIPVFWASGLVLWWQARRQAPRRSRNSPMAQADMQIFVASEGGSTWGFAQALHQALMQAGHTVHTAALEDFQIGAKARHVFVLAATYGDGQAPAHAAQALKRIASQPAGTATVSVLGFGDRQFTAFCGYAEAVEQALRTQGWASLLPLERIHQQSAQQFARWGEALSGALNEPLVLNYVPRIPSTTALTLVSRHDHVGGVGAPTAILRFAWPAQSGWRRLQGRGLARFEAGDLVGILPPGSAIPRFYSLASGYRDGFLEICVRLIPNGVCSGFLHGLKPGDRIDAFIKPNPSFALEGTRQPVVLIGAGTGVAPLAGFIRDNTQRVPMHLYFGARDPKVDFYFGKELRHWLEDHRLASLKTAFSRVPEGGGHVQDALRRDAARLRELIDQGAILRVCGSRPMAQGVAEALDGILAAISLNVQQLKAGGRYAEDVF